MLKSIIKHPELKTGFQNSFLSLGSSASQCPEKRVHLRQDTQDQRPYGFQLIMGLEVPQQMEMHDEEELFRKPHKSQYLLFDLSH